MMSELLAWGFIAGIYILAFGVIALPKHWYRVAQTSFILATLMADVKIIHWAITSSHGLGMRRFWCSVGLIATTGAAAWFIRKVQKDIREASGTKLNETRDSVKADPLDAVRFAEVRSEWGKLTTEQQRLLGRILVSGGLSWDQVDVGYWKTLPVYSDWQLSDYLLERSTLLEHRSKGNADLRSYIQSRKEGKTDFTLGRRTWKVKAEFIDALRQVVAEPVTAITDAQRNVGTRLRPERPELNITFDESGAGFVHRFKGESHDRKDVVGWKLYRVALRSSSTAMGTRLRAVDVTLAGGDNYPSLPLRIMGDHEATEFKLHADIAQLWDVVEKPIGSDWIRITHAVKTVPPLIVQAPYCFKITASCDQGFTANKLVKLSVDEANNNELMFQLDDI